MRMPFSRRGNGKRASARLKVGLWLLLALAAGSLYTPYPAQLVKALREEPKAKVKVVVRYVEKKDAPAPTTLDFSRLGDASSSEEEKPIQKWNPETAFSMPKIELPPFPPALPERVETGDFIHMSSIANGINLASNVRFTPGSTASQDRKKKAAYQLRVSLNLIMPHAALGKELLLANPRLSAVLTEFDDLMSRAKVSPWFHALYLHKQNYIRKNAATLTRLLDRHNFYDTDTILEASSSATGRKILWLQADMDVVSDGSDGDRLPNMPDSITNSDHYQATTSYRWKKRTKTPNPLLPHWQNKLSRLKKATKPDAGSIASTQRLIDELKRSSFLLAEYDPFIVVPLTFKEGRSSAYRPQPGDYVAVVVENKVYPAIVGDFGPRHKTGEASLRLGKLVNPKTTSFARAVSSLGASYIIFPGSKEEENGPIDYHRLNTRVRELLDEIGGLGPEAQYIEIPNLLKKEDTPSSPSDHSQKTPSPENEKPPTSREIPRSPSEREAPPLPNLPVS